VEAERNRRLEVDLTVLSVRLSVCLSVCVCRRGLLWKVPVVLLSLGLAAAGGYWGYQQYEEHKDKKDKDSSKQTAPKK
jgi:hypothetical protein